MGMKNGVHKVVWETPKRARAKGRPLGRPPEWPLILAPLLGSRGRWGRIAVTRTPQSAHQMAYYLKTRAALPHLEEGSWEFLSEGKKVYGRWTDQ